jgi:two-component system response regulator TctD
MTMSAEPERAARRPVVVVAEDSAGDAVLLREALRSRAPTVRLERVGDGLTALRRLARTGEFAVSDPADLLVLDLGLPHLDGRAVLARLRIAGGRTPVVVLTGSQRRVDRAECERLGAVHYALKPSYFGEWLRVADLIAAELRRAAAEREDTPTPLGSAVV